MAFDFLNQQVRLSFSMAAEVVIAHDMDIFGITSRSTFINQILNNYYETANASIVRQLSEYEDELSSINGYDRSLLFIKQLKVKKKDELMNVVSSYESAEKDTGQNPIRLQDNFAEYLRDDNRNHEDKIYKSVPKYCKAIVEEYVRLPFVERERIFYKEIITTIEQAIKGEYQLYISTGQKDNSLSQSSFFVVPYKIMTDPLSTANYLVGYSYLPDQNKSDKKMSSFRISRIMKVKNETSRSAFLSAANKAQLQHAINTKGVMFLLGSSDDIVKVRLTNNGVKLFKRVITMRPVPTSIEGNIYTFNCTSQQAWNYFIRLGKEAEILEPQELRQRFKTEYESASKIYN